MSPLPSPDRVRVRIAFSKSGRASYLSHADMVRAWERAFRRAAAPLAYSAGYSPGPQLRFGPPVPVGYEAREELLDADLDRPVALAELLDGLNAALPSGLAVKSADYVPLGRNSLMSSARAAEYLITIEPAPVDIGTRIAEFMARDSAVMEVRHGERSRELDVRAQVRQMAPAGDGLIQMRLALGHGASCRPEDVAAALGLSVAHVVRLKVDYQSPEGAGEREG